jgi:hypothetical protein
MSVASGAACGLFLVAGLALGAASFNDAAGDENAAPDITSVSVSEAADGLVTIVVAVQNYQSLPDDSWFNLWFDIDSNEDTGDVGDEALVRYVSTGELELYGWDGAEMVERPTPAGITGRFAAGVLTVTVPKADLGGDTSFGFLAVSSRRQGVGTSQFIASDFSPDRGRSAYAGPAQIAFPDASHDEDAAPDITSVRVSDAKDGWITFAVTTRNYSTLPGDSVVALAVDQDNRPGTGDAGAEVLVRSLGGETLFERWDPAARAWVDDEPPHRARLRNADGVVTIELHRSELANVSRFGFAITSADLNTQAELVLGIDLAPDDGGFYHYALAHKPTLTLVATRLYATPARPRAGKPFAVNLAVRRSDTSAGITAATVSCVAVLDKKPLKGKGSVAGGAGHCSFVIPKSAAGRLLRGTITVRVSGKSVAADFAYVVR